nr:S26 family signal peptidase [Natronomonas salina]
MTGFLTADSGAAVYLRDVFTSVAAVLLVGALLFGVSGIWPPMVAVESGSMEPNMNVGDLVFVVDNERFVPDDAVAHEGETTGVVPADVAAEVNHKEFGEHGDVIVFMPDGSERQTPVIHRAMLFVEEGENWYDRADQGAVGSADDCDELDYCPAPHAGFITKGDNEQSNSNYDQVSGLSGPVHPDWVVGTAEVKIPYLGYVRLMFSNQMVAPMDSGPVTQPTAAAAGPGETTAGAAAAPGARNVRPVA